MPTLKVQLGALLQSQCRSRSVVGGYGGVRAVRCARSSCSCVLVCCSVAMARVATVVQPRADDVESV